MGWTDDRAVVPCEASGMHASCSKRPNLLMAPLSVHNNRQCFFCGAQQSSCQNTFTTKLASPYGGNTGRPKKGGSNGENHQAKSGYCLVPARQVRVRACLLSLQGTNILAAHA